EILFEKIKHLPPQKIAEVINFVDFLVEREEKQLVESAAKLSEKSFGRVWNNDEDAVYDEL
ncbi:MAG: DUF2281 domain-containing protein, partial [Acidobacteriota bacterium]|nr:DUF2281 domain-containing protein [Acidobacteriota bacterium]